MDDDVEDDVDGLSRSRRRGCDDVGSDRHDIQMRCGGDDVQMPTMTEPAPMRFPWREVGDDAGGGGGDDVWKMGGSEVTECRRGVARVVGVVSGMSSRRRDEDGHDDDAGDGCRRRRWRSVTMSKARVDRCVPLLQFPCFILICSLMSEPSARG